MNSDGRLSRSRLLLGDTVMERLANARVIVFGLGGVGSWAVEALARTGLRHLTIVDNDCVTESNINRQMPARIDTVGRLKVEVVKEHIALINPEAEVTALAVPYTPKRLPTFILRATIM
ncbi:MAG: ThiF family adenylyltransferase [Muribaculaceae bacterium]|nr:ThiF family adenylyltransferase [Muribaculaceae bacterium]